jgi:quercetin dioxygenase-like cupin family protein
MRTGQRVRNLLSGETLTFRTTSAESGGKVVESELELRPLGAPGGAPHRHRVAERFHFIRGTACVWIAGRRPRIAVAGDVVEVPPGRWHFVLALAPTSARVVISPGMHFDELLAAWAAIGSGDLRPSAIRRVLPLLREHGCI